MDTLQSDESFVTEATEEVLAAFEDDILGQVDRKTALADEMLPIAAISRVYGIAPRTIRRWAESGDIIGERRRLEGTPGGREVWYVDRHSVESRVGRPDKPGPRPQLSDRHTVPMSLYVAERERVEALHAKIAELQDALTDITGQFATATAALQFYGAAERPQLETAARRKWYQRRQT